MTDDELEPDDKSNDVDDPFSEFDDIDNRDGDPFEDFDPPTEPADEPNTGDSITESQSDSAATNSDGQEADSPQPGTDAKKGHLEVTSPADIAPDVDIQDGVFDTDHGDDDPFGADSPFEKVDTETIDEEALWEEIQSDESDTAEDSTSPSASAIDEVVVSKSKFCQQCKYFAEPPNIGCEHDGTEIVEFVGADDIRISNCPVVAKERELGHDID